MASYEPGRRNIGPAEVRRRQRLGIIGAVASVLLFALYLVGAPRSARSLMALPLLLTALGWVQAMAGT